MTPLKLCSASFDQIISNAIFIFHPLHYLGVGRYSPAIKIGHTSPQGFLNGLFIFQAVLRFVIIV